MEGTKTSSEAPEALIELPPPPEPPSNLADENLTDNNKLELINLSKNPNYAILKNLLERRFKVYPRKLKLGRSNAFLTFKDEAERDDAIIKLNNQELKGKTIVARVAVDRDDPLQKKRRLCNEADIKDEYKLDTPVTDAETNERVCPLIGKSYDEQLVIKQSLMRNILNMSKQIQKMSHTLQKDAPDLFEWTTKHRKIACQFDGIVASPTIKGYRNKCEFTISRNGDVGFKIGKYRDGSEQVCRPPNDCPLLTGAMFEIVDLMSRHLKTMSKLEGFDTVTHHGHYRQITIRCNSINEYLLIIDVHPQDLTEENLNNEILSIIDLFQPVKQIVSIYFNISAKNSFSSAHQALRLVYGKECLYEQLCVNEKQPLKFRIGPASFFQVNSKAAELLYRSIIEVAQLGPDSMVLDVGCGTGTIGLSLASKVNHVVGIEIVRQAIEDAKSNALENGIDNATFYAGTAEDLISESITILKNKLDYQKLDGEIVAIVDPPRAGFTNSFIKAIRASEIKRIVYIACDPKANTNLLNLCRPRSKAYQGEPFVPIRAKAFDLFPHTKCCELLLVYERLSLVLKRDTTDLLNV